MAVKDRRTKNSAEKIKIQDESRSERKKNENKEKKRIVDQMRLDGVDGENMNG